MPLRTQWRELTRSTIGSAPERYGVYELGDAEGTVLSVGAGVLRQELKEAMAYGDAARVRWEATPSRERAEELAAEHRDRL